VIVFVHEDPAYRAWIARHRDGFVLDWRRDARRTPPRLHRAGCSEVRRAAGEKMHPTSGRRAKACSRDAAELRDWARQDIGHAAAACELCAPEAAASPIAPSALRGAAAPTRLGREIVDAVVEAAVIHLDRRDGGYDWTLAHVARAVGRTTAQIRATVARLIAEGLLEGGAEPLGAGTPLLPTGRSLRTLPAFAAASDDEIDAELAGLRRSNAFDTR
jgi:hypothetical protein